MRFAQERTHLLGLEHPPLKRQLHLCRPILMLSALPPKPFLQHTFHAYWYQTCWLFAFSLNPFASHPILNPLNPPRLARGDKTPRLASTTCACRASNAVNVFGCAAFGGEVVLDYETDEWEVKPAGGDGGGEKDGGL